MIAVLVPVLRRPASAQPLADSLYAASPDVRLIFVVSATDQDQFAACKATGADIIESEWVPGPGDFARKINKGLRETTEPFLFQAADDVEFTAGWDDEVLRVAEDTGAGVVGTNDDANPLVKAGKHATHSLIRRTYADDPGASFDGPGTVFSERYGHQYVDNELYGLAVSRGQWAFAVKSVVRHRHPIFDRSVKRDTTYELGDSTRHQDFKLFRLRQRQWA